MSEKRIVNRMTQKEMFNLCTTLQKFHQEEKLFKDYNQAIVVLSREIGEHVTKGNILSACKCLEMEPSAFIKKTGRKNQSAMSALTARIEKLETVNKTLEDSLYQVWEALDHVRKDIINIKRDVTTIAKNTPHADGDN